jgi:hypothetical protein
MDELTAERLNDFIKFLNNNTHEALSYDEQFWSGFDTASKLVINLIIHVRNKSNEKSKRSFLFELEDLIKNMIEEYRI